MVTLSEVNTLPREAFVALLGGVFEGSPWVAERAEPARPFVDIGALHTAMVHAVRDATREEQLTLLCAHPELAGKAARAGEMTADSQSEQASAGLTALDTEAGARMDALNARYRRKFGFPFIIAVRNHTRQSIFAELERRYGNMPEAELANALDEVYAITRMRLEALVAPPA